MSNLPSAPGDSAPSDRALASTLIISSVVAVGCFVAFSIFRRLFLDFYTYRMHNQHASPEARFGLFSWLRPTVNYPEKLMVRTHGLDTAMMLRFFSSLAFFFAVYCVFSMLVLAPVNATGTNKRRNTSDPLFVNGLAILSIANLNVSRNSEKQRLWLHASAIVVFTIALMWLVTRDYRKFVKYRQLIRKFDTCNNYSVMVSQIEQSDRSDSTRQSVSVSEGLNSQPHNHSGLMAYFQRLFPQKVVSATLVWNLSGTEIARLLKQYQKTLHKLNQAKARYDATGVRPVEHQSLLTTADRIDHYTFHARQLQHQIAVAEENVTSVQTTQVGFVTFHDRPSAAVCSQLLLNRQADKWRVREAPDPKDVFWENLHISDWSRLVRWALVTFAIILLILFWSFPLAVALSFASLDKIRHLPILDRIFNPLLSFLGPYGSSVIQGLLPVILVAILAKIPLVIIRKLSDSRGFLTHSESERTARNYYFSFLFFNVFVLYTLGSGFVYNYRVLTKDLTLRAFLLTLASTVPPQAAFFASYILANALVGWFASELLRVSDLALALIERAFYMIIRRKPVDKIERLHRSEPFNYVSSYAISGIVFVVSITYSTMYPIILLFAALYFVAGYFVVRYELLYLNVQKYDSLGTIWPGSLGIILLGMILHQLVMLSLFVVYAFIPGAVMTLMLLVTTAVWYRTMQSLYRRTSKSPALEELMFARDEPGRLANDDPSGGVAFSRSPECVSAYLQPQRKTLLKIGSEQIEALSSDAPSSAHAIQA